MTKKTFLYTTLLAVLLEAPAAFSQKTAGLRPAVWKDDDMASIPEPTKHHDAMYFDFLHNTFGRAPRAYFQKLDQTQPAWNVNAWDEVPDSSWFTIRNHLKPLTPEEVFRGATHGQGPDLSSPLTVLEGKTAGTSLGFGRTRDARGNIYFIKFDPADYPEISTGAEVVGSRFFYAMGYHVPEEWIINVRADQIRVSPDANIWDKNGRHRKMTQADVEEMLKNAGRTPDGRYRAIASLGLRGKDKGAFKFFGTRKDDANDLIPHQDRRELRGLRLLCAWLNHYDIRSGNTLNFYVEENGRKFLRHFLLDFGSTLGSASTFPKVARMGYSYLFDLEAMAGPALTLGIYQPAWRDQPAPVQYSSVGRFESSQFSPADWKPVWPVESFVAMDDADAYWAAKIAMSFTPEQVRAAVEAGQYSDPEAEEYLVRTLIERQQKIGRYGFSRVNPLERFKISGTGSSQQLEFEDLAVNYSYAIAATTQYSYTLSPADDGTSGPPLSTSEPRIPLGALLASGQKTDSPNSLFVLTLRTRRAENGFADKSVKVYVQREASGFEIKGWEHEN